MNFFLPSPFDVLGPYQLLSPRQAGTVSQMRLGCKQLLQKYL